MFESAVQPTAESLETGARTRQPPAPGETAREVHGDRPRDRRYGAEDFHALSARLAAGAKPAPAPRAAPTAAPIALPDLLALFRRPDAGTTPPEQDPAAREPEPGDASHGPASPETEALALDDAIAAETSAEPATAAAHDHADATHETDEPAGRLQDGLLDYERELAAAPISPVDAAPPLAREQADGADSDETASAGSTEATAPQDDGYLGEEDTGGAEADSGESSGADTARGDTDATVEPDSNLCVAVGAAAVDWTEPDSGISLQEPQAAVAIAPSDPVPADAGPADEPGRAVAVPVWHDAFEADRQSGETARMLLDIMAMPSGAVQPQERALAGDTLLRLVSRMPIPSVISLCERLCIMETPPPLLVRRLIHHPKVEVAGPLLERCVAISDQDLMTLIGSADPVRLRLIARRRHLSPALTDALIDLGDSSVLLTVVRNPGAALSPEAFAIVAERAKSHHALQAPLATRADTPAPIAFELFWSLPPELRRYVLSRFLTESATLDRILKIAHTLDDSSSPAGPAASRTADREQIDDLVAKLAEGETAEAAQRLAAIAGICQANALRIISDPAGEPLTVAMKALGLSRTQFAAAAETLNNAPAAPLRAQRRIGELKTLFDSLSFTKARVLLTYWDWAVEQSGPYSGRTD